MIQLTDTLQWDGTKEFYEQLPEVQNFISNVIATYDKTTTKEAIPNSPFFRVLTANYDSDGFTVVEKFEYQEPVSGSGWAAIKSRKVNCYAK